MIIGIDGNEANVERKVGIGEYAFELLKQFEQLSPPVGRIEFRIYLKNKPREGMPKEREGWKYRVVGPSKFWNQFALPLDLFFHRGRPDIFFTLSHYAPRFSPIPTAVSVMDLSYIHFPHLFKRSDLYQLRNWTAYSVKNASIVFTISQASKDDIIKEYGVPEKRIAVTYPGIKSEIRSASWRTKFNPSINSGLILSEVEGIKMQNSKLLKDKYGIEDKYVLFVGTLQPRKNIVRLVEALSMLKSDIKLVIVGKKGWMYEEILESPKKFKIEDKVKFLDFVPDEDLPAFYKNALCFVLPSLYEGFGLPVLEAMKYGCPVITSNVSSLPEAGGDAALYVDPLSVEDIIEKLELLIKDEDLRKKLIKKGYEQAKKFNWEKTARETLKVLESIKY